MTSVEAALIGAITTEISNILDGCRSELRKIEDAIGSWYEGGVSSEAFPITELQRLDLIYQVQVDLARVTAFTGGALTAGEPIDQEILSGILEVATLDDVRSRFARVGDTAPITAEVEAQAPAQRQGTPELF